MVNTSYLVQLLCQSATTAQVCKNMHAMCTYSNWVSILHTTIGGWVATLGDTLGAAKGVFGLSRIARHFWKKSRQLPIIQLNCPTLKNVPTVPFF